MKSESTIKIEYNQIINQATKLGNCSDDLANIARELDQLIDSLRTGWAGESADIYFGKCNELYAKIKRASLDLDTTSSVIKRTAKIYRDTELAAIRLVQE